MGRIIPYIPYIMENKSHVWNHQPVYGLYGNYIITNKHYIYLGI
jgi:hypothetical protein